MDSEDIVKARLTKPGGQLMSRDRYLKIILTVIAIELGWIALTDTGVQVSAQQNPPMTSVVIRGIDLPCQGNAINCRETSLPIDIARQTTPVRIAADAPLPVNASGIVRIRADQPMIVETGERPLLIQSVPAGTSPRPGPGE
jgi:hypothetical protein